MELRELSNEEQCRLRDLDRIAISIGAQSLSPQVADCLRGCRPPGVGLALLRQLDELRQKVPSDAHGISLLFEMCCRVGSRDEREAARYLSSCLEMREKTLTPHHPDLLRARYIQAVHFPPRSGSSAVAILESCISQRDFCGELENSCLLDTALKLIDVYLQDHGLTQATELIRWILGCAKGDSESASRMKRELSLELRASTQKAVEKCLKQVALGRATEVLRWRLEYVEGEPECVTRVKDELDLALLLLLQGATSEARDLIRSSVRNAGTAITEVDPMYLARLAGAAHEVGDEQLAAHAHECYVHGCQRAGIAREPFVFPMSDLCASRGKLELCLPAGWNSNQTPCPSSTKHVWTNTAHPYHKLYCVAFYTPCGVGEVGGTLEEAVARRIGRRGVASDINIRSLSESRVLGRYRTTLCEPGVAGPKDDRHWVLCDRKLGSSRRIRDATFDDPEGLRTALLTLSVLKDRANLVETEQLVETIERSISEGKIKRVFSWR